MPEADPPKTVIVHNPESGSGEHGEAIRDRAAIEGYELLTTAEAGDARAFAEDAAGDDADLVVAAGGDGTVNEVARGMGDADAFDRVTLGVLPVGTGNDFANNLGITGLDDGFAVLREGERRRIDVGWAEDRPFVNSCVAGLTANSSDDTSSEMKRRFGALAYAITTLRSLSEFESVPLTVDIHGDGSEVTAWSGEAICVLVGSGRRFTRRGSRQAHMEDGLFDVTVIEDVPAFDLLRDAVTERLLDRDSPHVTRTKAAAVEIDTRRSEPIQFSLDGEIVKRQRLSLHTRPHTLRVAVGDAYEPDPD